MLRIIGDTHVKTFLKVPSVVTYSLGDISALKISKFSYDILGEINKHSFDPWAFYAGELDCRLMIFDKSVQLETDTYTIVQYIINKYVNFVELLNNTFDVWVISTPPQGPSKDSFGRQFYATQDMRQAITNQFNNYLKQQCILRDIKFLDIWRDIGCSKKDILPGEYFEEDQIHLISEYASQTLRKYLNKL